MWRCTISPSGEPSGWAAEAAHRLRRGQVLAYPTDTLYGLAADPRLSAALERLFDVKGRATDVALPLIAASLEQLEACGACLPAAARRLAARWWPGPLTIVVPAWPGLSEALLAGGHTAAVRVPDHRVARELASALGYPITSTSANRSGEPPTHLPDGLADGLAIDGLIDAGPSPGGVPSTIVDVSSGAPRIVRAGAVPAERVLESLA